MTEKEILDFMENSPGFIRHNHFHLVEYKQLEKAVLQVELTEDTLNPYGYAHGGLIFGLGDTAMGIIAKSSGRKAVTQNASITYLRPNVGKTIRAEANMIKNGKKVCYIRCDFYNENEKLTATMNASYYYVD